MQTIRFFARTVYGTTMIYPANEAAEILARIAGTKTLSRADLDLAKRLGLQIEQVADPKMPKLG